MSEPSTPPPRILLVILDTLIFVALLSGFCAFLLPVINTAREGAQVPLVLPFLQPWYESSPWLFPAVVPLITTGLTALLIVGLRQCFPPGWRRHFPWRAPPGTPIAPFDTNEDPRATWASAGLSLLGTLLLVLAVAHVRVDRTHRQPVVWTVGPLAGIVPQMVYIGLACSIVSLMCANYSLVVYRGRYRGLELLGLLLGCFNLCGSCIVTAGIYED